MSDHYERQIGIPCYCPFLVLPWEKATNIFTTQLAELAWKNADTSILALTRSNCDIIYYNYFIFIIIIIIFCLYLLTVQSNIQNSFQNKNPTVTNQ